jgi:RHS repeat-associated protein
MKQKPISFIDDTGFIMTQNRRRQWRRFAVVACALILFGGAYQAEAHTCVTSHLVLTVGDIYQNLLIISADQERAVDTIYTILGSTDPTIAELTGSFDGINGIFSTFGLKTGETIFAIQWEYPPNFAAGVCFYKVTIVEETGTANANNSGVAGDPVNTRNGELFFHENRLLLIKGLMPLFIQPYYASDLRRSFVISRLGDNWRHNFDWTLNNVGNVLQIITGEGRVLRFIKQNTQQGGWDSAAPSDISFQVTQQTTGEVRFFLLDPRTNYIYTFGAPIGANSFKLIRIEDSKGNSQALAYNAAGDLENVTNNLGKQLTFIYDLNANNAERKLRSVTDGFRAVNFNYNGDYLVSLQNERGDLIQYLYDTAHVDPALLKMRIKPQGNSPFRQTWNDVGQVETQSDAAGNIFLFDYTGGQTTVSEPGGKSTVHQHDANGALTRATDQDGNVIAIDNDASGKRVVVSDPIGGINGFDYDAISGRVTLDTNENNDTVAYQFTSRLHSSGLELRDLTAIDFPDGTREVFTHDALGNRISENDRVGNLTARTFNGTGQVLSETSPTGAVTTHSYDIDGNLIAMEDPAGNTTTFTYDAFNRLTRITRPDGTNREFTYDLTGLLLSMTDERNKTVTFDYDRNDNLLSVTDPAGNVTAYTYDNDDRLVTLTDRTGVVISYNYDSLGRLAQVSYGNGETFTYNYDSRGNLSAITDPEGGTWSTQYDISGRAVSGTNPLGLSGRHGHDPLGRITMIADGEGNETIFTYDSLGRVVAVRDGLGQITNYSFDANGWLAGMSLGAGTVTASYERNGRSLLKRITDANGNDWRFAYDPQGRMTSRTDALNRVTTYSYDNRNRISTVQFPDGIGSLTMTYNGTGHATQRAYSDGTLYAYNHDDLGRLIGFTGGQFAYDAESRMTQSNGITIAYDPATGRMSTVTLAPGKTVSYAYNGLGRVVSVSDWLGGTTSFSHDAAGRLISMTPPNGLTTTFTYDNADRIVAITDGGLSSVSLTRDANGRVVNATRMTPISFSPSADARNFAFDAPGQVATFAYDLLGRLIQDDRRSYTWNLASGLTGYSEGAKNVSFTRNALGHILTRAENGVTREYVWNYAFDFPAISVFRENGQDERYYVHDPRGRLLYVVDAATGLRRFFHFDEIGNTLFLSDELGSITTRYAYSPYGALISSGVPSDNPFTFVGRYGVMQEGNSGLYLMRQRYYDSVTMRFISPDLVFPHLHPLAIIPYAYAAVDPINHFDPTGSDVGDAAIDTTRSLGLAAGKAAQELGPQADTAKVTADWLEGWVNQITLLSQDPKTGTPQAIVKFRGKEFNARGLGFKLSEPASDAANQAARLNRIVKPLKVAGRIGTGAQILDVGLELNKFKNALNKALEDYDVRIRYAGNVFAEKSATAIAIYKKKKKSLGWLEAKLRLYRSEMEAELFYASYSYDLDFLFGFWTAWGNSIGSFVPGFTGFDIDRGESVGFFGF